MLNQASIVSNILVYTSLFLNGFLGIILNSEKILRGTTKTSLKLLSTKHSQICISVYTDAYDMYAFINKSENAR